MKIRKGFVSNSSASSFIISKDNLTEGQMEAIRKHDVYASIIDKHYKQMGKDIQAAGFDLEDIDYRLFELVSDISGDKSYFDFTDKWNVKETDSEIILGTIVDNFNMLKFLKFIGVDDNSIEHYPDQNLFYEW